MKNFYEIGCFISPHGFGHATRICAILEVFNRNSSELQSHLFTTVPKSIFEESLNHFHYHYVLTDVGMTQRDSLHVDIEETILQLDQLLPYPQSLIDTLADQCRNFDFIFSDISPLGILVARQAGVPSILIENFTWDWIYQPYFTQNRRMEQFSSYFKEIFHQADYHIQTEPVCHPSHADLHCGPIYRPFRTNSQTIRSSLGCRKRKMVFISMGGIGMELPFLKKLSRCNDVLFVIAGQQAKRSTANYIMLNHRSNYYHPDLIHAADLVLCKTGYSTIAECCQTSNRIVGVSRKMFPESAVLETFIRQEMGGTIIDPDDFLSGTWLDLLEGLLNEPSGRTKRNNGAEEVADFLLQLS